MVLCGESNSMGCWFSKTPRRHLLPHDLVPLCKATCERPHSSFPPGKSFSGVLTSPYPLSFYQAEVRNSHIQLHSSVKPSWKTLPTKIFNVAGRKLNAVHASGSSGQDKFSCFPRKTMTSPFLLQCLGRLMLSNCSIRAASLSLQAQRFNLLSPHTRIQ